MTTSAKSQPPAIERSRDADLDRELVAMIADERWSKLSNGEKGAWAHAMRNGLPWPPDPKIDTWIPPSADELRRDRLAGRQHRQEPEWRQRKMEREASEARRREQLAARMAPEIAAAFDEFEGDYVTTAMLSRGLNEGSIDTGILGQIRRQHERRTYIVKGKLPSYLQAEA